MCEGTGKDRMAVMSEPDAIGITTVLGHVQIDRPCRTCRGCQREHDLEPDDALIPDPRTTTEVPF